MKCSIKGCPGEYQKNDIVHTVCHRGKVIVIGNVPAEVCAICGDALLEPETVQYIEELLETRSRPAEMVPLSTLR